jgi:hypothetical protein
MDKPVMFGLIWPAGLAKCISGLAGVWWQGPQTVHYTLCVLLATEPSPDGVRRFPYKVIP